MEEEIIDLFDHIEELPEEVQAIIVTSNFIEPTYENCELLLTALKPYGYTFDYYLNAEPYNLRKI